MTPAQAVAVLAWLETCQRYRNLTLLRTGNDGALETDLFRAQYPDIQAGLDRLAEIAKESP